MGRKVKQLKNYTTEDIEAIFDSNKDYRTGMKLCAIIQLSSRKLVASVSNKYAIGQIVLMQKE
jgi:hypothetical protein